jgi:hypothetical protein
MGVIIGCRNRSNVGIDTNTWEQEDLITEAVKPLLQSKKLFSFNWIIKGKGLEH